jgi:hypothetical protein
MTKRAYGVVCMDKVRIKLFLGELYGLSCFACDIGDTLLYGKAKENLYIIASQEFGNNLIYNNLFIDIHCCMN